MPRTSSTWTKENYLNHGGHVRSYANLRIRCQELENKLLDTKEEMQREIDRLNKEIFVKIKCTGYLRTCRKCNNFFRTKRKRATVCSKCRLTTGGYCL